MAEIEQLGRKLHERVLERAEADSEWKRHFIKDPPRAVGDMPEAQRLREKLSRTYVGSYRQAFEYVVERLREGLLTRRTREETLKAKAEARRRAPRSLARLFARDAEKLCASDREHLRELLGGLNSELERAYELAQGFSRMLRERHPEMLDGWLQEASDTDSPELSGFVEGLGADHGAARAPLWERWSNGHVEGQIHRLKLLKRQMYGRATSICSSDEPWEPPKERTGSPRISGGPCPRSPKGRKSRYEPGVRSDGADA